MSKFVRFAQTSQSLSLAAMEEVSRLGLREADIEHLFLALVINEQSAGRSLRSMGIDLDAARRAVEEQHEAQLVTLGIDTTFPEPGRIVLHETHGYQLTKRASDLIARSGGRGKQGDATAVLRELVREPSGLIASILRRLGTTPDALLEYLDLPDAPGEKSPPAGTKVKGRVSGSSDSFLPAPVEQVWEFLADPTHVPEWEMSVGSIDHFGQDATPGAVWQGHTRTRLPDGKPLKVKPNFHRRSIEAVAADRPNRVAWRLAYPDSPRSPGLLTEFTLAGTTSGTHVTITTSWLRRRGWRGVVGLPLFPIRKFLLWISVFQTGSALGRVFR